MHSLVRLGQSIFILLGTLEPEGGVDSALQQARVRQLLLVAVRVDRSSVGECLN